jgi:hypothetical protein
MTMAITTVRNTNQETVIHFESTAAESGTITIANLAASTQARNSDTPTVNIVKFLATGEDAAVLKIVRNSKNVISCAPENAPFLDFNANGINVTNDNTYDIVITNAAAKAVTGWLVLRKVAGWSTKVEYATYGAYEDETRVGGSTTKSGSPGGVPSAN